MRKQGRKLLLILLGVCLLTACSLGQSASQDQGQPLEIGATVPYSEILEYVKPLLKERGVDIKVTEFTDYLSPNLALEDGSIDANYFQHEAYFEESKAKNNLDLVSMGRFYFGPMAIYSDKHSSLDEIPQGGQIIIPNDPTNEARALNLLHDAGLIGLEDSGNLTSSPEDIIANPKNLNITSLDAAAIPSALEDCDAALINFNYALDYGLSDKEEALFVEATKEDYTNLVAVRAGEEDREVFKTLVEVLQSDEVQAWVLEEYDGNLIPVEEVDGQLRPVEIDLILLDHEKDKDQAKTKEEKMDKIKTIYLAGGCFWGVEEYFSRIAGVISATPGYANGQSDQTSYREIGRTGHAETVRLVYDTEIIHLKWILEYFFRIIDPTILNRQGNDVGTQYRTGIYYTDSEDLEAINQTIKDQQAFYEDEIVVEVDPLENFVIAEDYHIDYLKKNPGGYCHVDLSTTPDDHLEYVDLDDVLTDQEYKIMKEEGTDRAFSHELDDFYEPGVYLDKISKTPLFLSTHKYDAGCGWPSFTKPLVGSGIEYLEDRSLGMVRTEVRSRTSDSHLGHVFEDGPKDEGGLRYCMNGSALDFIPYEDLEVYGLEKYKDLIDQE